MFSSNVLARGSAGPDWTAAPGTQRADSVGRRPAAAIQGPPTGNRSRLVSSLAILGRISIPGAVLRAPGRVYRRGAAGTGPDRATGDGDVWK